jgi:hypothetical protein
MSVTRQVTVWCDECGNWEQATLRTAQMRKELKKKGWSFKNTYDFCPKCTQKKLEEKKLNDY